MPVQYEGEIQVLSYDEHIRKLKRKLQQSEKDVAEKDKKIMCLEDIISEMKSSYKELEEKNKVLRRNLYLKRRELNGTVETKAEAQRVQETAA